MTDLRMTLPILKVLQALLGAGPDEHLYGLQLSEQTGLKSGTLYPVLARLERAGWVSSSWEQIDPAHAGRPRRRYYQLTGLGERSGTAELAKFTANQQRQPSTPTARPAWGQA